MARAKLARAWPALFWCCFYQHQSSTRPAPGADQRVSERSSARPGLNSLHGQRSHDSRAYRTRAEANELYRSTSALYMACPVTMTVIRGSPRGSGFWINTIHLIAFYVKYNLNKIVCIYTYTYKTNILIFFLSK